VQAEAMGYLPSELYNQCPSINNVRFNSESQQTRTLNFWRLKNNWKNMTKAGYVGLTRKQLKVMYSVTALSVS
jgi:hypothetical protein